MESGQDAGAPASPAQEATDGPAAAGDDAPGAGAGDQAPRGGDDEARARADDEVPSAGDEDEAAAIAGPAASSGGSADPGHVAGAPVWAAAMAVLLVLLIAGVVVSLVSLAHVRSSDAAGSRRQAAVAAARNAVTDLTTADYQHPQQYVDKLKTEATGSFVSMLTNSAAGFRNLLEQGKVQTAGNVVDVGVQQIGTDTAQLSVLAYITVKNSQAPHGDQRAYRLSVSMISAGSHWLVSNVEFVQ